MRRALILLQRQSTATIDKRNDSVMPRMTYKFHARIHREAGYPFLAVQCSWKRLPEGKDAYEGKGARIEDDNRVRGRIKLEE